MAGKLAGCRVTFNGNSQLWRESQAWLADLEDIADAPFIHLEGALCEHESCRTEYDGAPLSTIMVT